MAGYNDPQPPKDNWTARLYKEHGLTAASTMEDIEPIATRLLGSLDTALAGAELTLGRRVDGRDTKTAMVYASMGLEAKTRFALLLVQKATEE